jgi:hypothetical protein
MNSNTSCLIIQILHFPLDSNISHSPSRHCRSSSSMRFRASSLRLPWSTPEVTSGMGISRYTHSTHEVNNIAHNNHLHLTHAAPLHAAPYHVRRCDVSVHMWTSHLDAVHSRPGRDHGQYLSYHVHKLIGGVILVVACLPQLVKTRSCAIVRDVKSIIMIIIIIIHIAISSTGTRSLDSLLQQKSLTSDDQCGVYLQAIRSERRVLEVLPHAVQVAVAAHVRQVRHHVCNDL